MHLGGDLRFNCHLDAMLMNPEWLDRPWPRGTAGTRDVWEEQDTKLVAAQARFFKDRLVLGVGYRWDTLDVENYGSLRNPQVRWTPYKTAAHQVCRGSRAEQQCRRAVGERDPIPDAEQHRLAGHLQQEPVRIVLVCAA